jgi:hypothetical protein
VCAGTITAEGCIDAALCYQARSTTPFERVTIGMDDVFAFPFGMLSSPRDLCVAASTAGGALLDPAGSLVRFPIRVSTTFVTGLWHVTDQFGAFDAETRRLDRVLLATAASSAGPPGGPPPAGSANHYACRRLQFAAGSTAARGLVVSVDDALGNHQGMLLRPDRLCRPADVEAPGTGLAHPRASLMCYGLRGAATSGRAAVAQVHTANLLGAGGLDAFDARELCVPAAAIPLPVSPCATSGDECGLPCCRVYPGQHADCTYDPVVPTPRYRGCLGPTIVVDRTHVNFHETTPESPRNPGRYWGFAKQLVRDGYVVRDSTVPFAELLPTTSAKIIVVANPRTITGQEAVAPADAAALVDWIRNGGSLLLSIDHPPFERTGALLLDLGLVRLGKTAGQHTFTRANGDLNGASVIANGTGADTVVNEVTTFTGTAFSISPSPPADASYEAVLTFPPGTPKLAGLLQGVAIQLGAGRVYVSGESGGLTAQNAFGMQFTPDNEQYLRNVIHWLDS